MYVSSVDRNVMIDANLPIILVVEDNEPLREFIANGLSDRYKVLTAADGSQGWEVCQHELPDLVLSDVVMPKMNGYELCRAIKEAPQTSHIAVILLTAKASTESKIEGLSAGANDYLTKPFNHRELQLRVNNLLQYQQVLRTFHHRQFSRPDAPQESDTTESPFIGQLYQILEREIDNTGLSVEHLAADVAMSPRTLNRKLSTLVGMTVNEFIRNYRLRKAAGLLKAGHAVSETAYLVGFESPSYFGQCFKELFDLSPSEYIRNSLSEI